MSGIGKRKGGRETGSARYRELVPQVSQLDVDELKRKDAEYGGSWKMRGGVGAFMMLARKWDRLENTTRAHGYDVFAACQDRERSEDLLNDIGDLRRYLLLVEAEVRAQRGE